MNWVLIAIYCQGLRFFEASRIVPAIGGLNPLLKEEVSKKVL